MSVPLARSAWLG